MQTVTRYAGVLSPRSASVFNRTYIPDPANTSMLSMYMYFLALSPPKEGAFPILPLMALKWSLGAAEESGKEYGHAAISLLHRLEVPNLDARKIPRF